MSLHRPTPFDLVFRQISQDVFPSIQTTLEDSGQDRRDRDRFLMAREVVTLLRELRPEEGLGEAIDQLAALVHHAYLFWEAGEHTVELSQERLAELLAGPQGDAGTDPPPAYYVQAPERRVWAEVIPGRPPEPLDGCFVHSSPEAGSLRVLGVFGVYPERDGFSVVEAVGSMPVALVREDGTALFAPVLPGGAAARLFSLVGEEELLELGWRTAKLGAGSRERRARGSDLGVTSSQLPAPRS
jgi:hypothetical protein